MTRCESCEELKDEINRLTLKMQNARKWEIKGAPLHEYLVLLREVYIKLIDKFAILNNIEKHTEIAELSVSLVNALFDELYNKKHDKEV